MYTAHRILLSVFLVLAVIGCCVSCGKPAFDGNRVANENGLFLCFKMLDRVEETTISAHAGESLSVQIMLENGTVDLTITSPDGASAYTGTDLKNGIFSVGLPADGAYHIAVTGRYAAGVVEVVRETATGMPHEFSVTVE